MPSPPAPPAPPAPPLAAPSTGSCGQQQEDSKMQDKQQEGAHRALFESIPQSGLKCDILMVVAKNRLLELEEFVRRLRVVFQFNITKGGSLAASWTADTRNSIEGDIYRSEPRAGLKPDCTLTIDDDDFIKVMAGKLNPQRAFMLSKLKVRGNIMLLQKLYTVWYDVRRKGLAPELDLIQDIMVEEPLIGGLKSEMMAVELVQRLVRRPHLVESIQLALQVNVFQLGQLRTQYYVAIESGRRPKLMRLYNAQTGKRVEPAPQADVQLSADDDDLVLIVYGLCKVAAALESGRLRAEGSAEAVQRALLLLDQPPIMTRL